MSYSLEEYNTDTTTSKLFKFKFLSKASDFKIEIYYFCLTIYTSL